MLTAIGKPDNSNYEQKRQRKKKITHSIAARI